MVRFQVITSNDYKTKHKNFAILYALHPTPFGKCLIGVTDTDNAVVHLAFSDKNDSIAVADLKGDWPLSELVEDTKNVTAEIMQKIFTQDGSVGDSIVVVLKGTEFQVKVWESLTSIPRGTSTTYEQVAQNIDKPKAIRAVANAIMKNKIAYLIPCHRVMGKSGSNKYTWGTERKQNILTYESQC